MGIDAMIFTTPTPGLLTSAQCAELAGCKTATWRAYVARGQAPAPAQRLGNSQLWDADEVHAWIMARPGPGNWRRTTPVSR